MPYYGKSDPYNQTEAARRMIAACNRQRWHIASSLLDLYEDEIVHVRGIGNYDCTPLHAAAAAGQTDLLVSLLDFGADVDAPATQGYTPLYMAVRNNRSNAVRLLLHAGADPDARCGGYTPLLCAVDKGYESIVACLLDAGASTYVENSGGDQPLHVAARLGYFDITQALIESGADIAMRGARGLTPMEVANEAGNFDICEYLRSGHFFSRSERYGRLIPYEGGSYSFSDRYLDCYGDYGDYGDYTGYGGYGGYMGYGGYGDYGDYGDFGGFGGYGGYRGYRGPRSMGGYLGYGDYDYPYSSSRYGGYNRMSRFWDRHGYSGYGYGLGLRSMFDDRYERYYGYGSRYRSRPWSPMLGDYGDDLSYGLHGSLDDDYLFRSKGYSYYGGSPYSSSNRLSRREKYRMRSYRSDDIAEIIGDFVGRAMSYSEKSRFMSRVEKNAHRYRISGSTLMSDRYGAESLARMLVTDSSGYAKSEDVWATVEFIRAFRDGGSYAY